MYLVKAEANQIEKIVAMSVRAFETDVNVGGIKGDCPPEYDSIKWHQQMAREGHLYQAMIGNDLVGAAIVFPDETENSVYIGRIFIDSIYHRKGFGIRLMDCIEKNFPWAAEFHLDTPCWNERTNAFYKRLGYRIIKNEDGFVFYQKRKNEPNKEVLYIHGKGGSAAECEYYKPLFPNCEVIGLDYQTFTPWETGAEIRAAVEALKAEGKRVILIANSIGAYFIMLTLRAIDENGKWLPKSRKVYDLDKEGNRIRLPSGQWKSHKENTVDWNDQKYGEIWRHEWEVLQNHFLERAGSEARVDMRSYERQGNELVPENHLGPSVSYLEKQGIKTEIGNLNRQIRKSNSLIASIRKAIKALFDWIKECKKLLTDTKVIDNPDDYSLYDVLMAYIDLRKEERANWNSRAQSKSNIKDYEKVFHLARVMEEKGIYTVNDLGSFLDKMQQKSADLSKEIKSKEQRIRDINAIFKAVDTMKSTRAVWEEYESIHWKGRKDKFKESHYDDLNAYRKAEYLLKKLQITLPINRKELTLESARLNYEIESLTKQSSQIKQTLDELKLLRWLTRKVIPDALPVLINGKQPFNDQIESNSNQVELQELKEKSFAQLDRRYQSIMQESIIEDEYDKPQMQEMHDGQKQSQPIKRTQNPERE